MPSIHPVAVLWLMEVRLQDALRRPWARRHRGTQRWQLGIRHIRVHRMISRAIGRSVRVYIVCLRTTLRFRLFSSLRMCCE